MKKQLLTLAAVATLAAMTLLTSCAKDGKDGTNGTNGTNGANGSNASTAYQLSSTIQATGWNQIGTAGTAGAHLEAHIVSSSLSYDSVGQGAVLVYEQQPTNNGGTTWEALSFTLVNAAANTFTHQFNWFDGGLNVDVFVSDYNFATETGPTIFNIVVIPGTKSLPVGLNLQDYASVVAHYKPRMIN